LSAFYERRKGDVNKEKNNKNKNIEELTTNNKN
jgi:hypothetical protein